MKRIVCELCGETEFTKDGGFYICQGCGTKFTLAEAKSMMVEVGGERAPAAPTAPAAPVMPDPQYEIRWYDEEAIEAFRGDERFLKAYSFCGTAPDVIGAAAVKDGAILGMVGASRDSETMWQIGIDVVPEARGRGLGVLLVSLLKNEILSRGRLPFYGTAVSHTISQNIAIRSGFKLAWVELGTAKTG